jgi:UDP-N-acetylmuramyl pentapeptide phosphotransferase/UDP-N-acetylglucosamine-1-phosphate transferase
VIVGTVGTAQAIGTGVGAVFATRIVGGMVADSALDRGWLDHPNNRSSHRRPVPRIGGIVVVPLCALVVLFDGHERISIVLAAIAAGLALVGLVDDFQCLSVGIRLVSQVLASALTVAFALPLRSVIIFGAPYDLGFLLPLVMFCWILVSINVFNFVDGIDGLAGGLLFANALTWLVVSFDAGFSARVGFVFLGCSIGFLMLNRSPARIFLGDVGSFGIGYLIAVLPLLYLPPERVIAVPVFVALPALADTVFTAVRRVRRGENLFLAHRSHLYQRLAVKYGHNKVSAAACFLSTASGLVGWLVFLNRSEGPTNPLSVWIGGIYLCSILVGIALLGYRFDKHAIV